MKRIGILIAALSVMFAGEALAAKAPANNAPPPIDKKARDQGMAEAPGAVTAAGPPASVKDAYWVNTIEDKKAKPPTKTSFYEVACNQGMGYLVQLSGDGKGAAFDCLSINGQAADDAANGKPGSITCRLPDNADAKMGLVPSLTAAGAPRAAPRPMRGPWARRPRATPITKCPAPTARAWCCRPARPPSRPSRAARPSWAAPPSAKADHQGQDPRQPEQRLRPSSGKACTVSDFRYVAAPRQEHDLL